MCIGMCIEPFACIARYHWAEARVIGGDQHAAPPPAGGGGRGRLYCLLDPDREPSGWPAGGSRHGDRQADLKVRASGLQDGCSVGPLSSDHLLRTGRSVV